MSTVNCSGTEAYALRALIEYIQRELPDLENAKLDAEYDYASVPLCVIDAVFSMGVRYEATSRTVAKFCYRHCWERLKGDGVPERKVSELVRILEPFEGRFEENNPFQNRQRTSPRSGITKAEAVYRFTSTLQKYQIETFADVMARGKNAMLKGAVQIIPGQASGISFSYFLMLAGHRDIVKPDRMLRRFVEKATGRTNVSQEEAEKLVIRSSVILRNSFPNLTAAVLDNAIWKFQRQSPLGRHVIAG